MYPHDANNPRGCSDADPRRSNATRGVRTDREIEGDYGDGAHPWQRRHAGRNFSTSQIVETGGAHCRPAGRPPGALSRRSEGACAARRLDDALCRFLAREIRQLESALEGDRSMIGTAERLDTQDIVV